MSQLLLLMLAVVSFAGTAFAENFIDIEQIGNTNTSTTLQDGTGNMIFGAILSGGLATFDPGSPALQNSPGGTNTLDVKQTGNNNKLGVYQEGTSTDLKINQFNGGNELEIYVDVGGTNSITVTQNGGVIGAKITQTGSGNYACPGDC